jgi:NADH-quinone oxidoreductase subunit F
MDRTIMESNPHQLLEGLLIGAYAVGAENAILYIRAEYPLATKRFYKFPEPCKKEG